MPAAECSTKEGDLPTGDLYRGKDLSGSLAGSYRLLSRVGQRGPADIYLGTTQCGASSVLVKVVDTMRAPATDVQLFNRERQLIGRFDHPNLARMLDEGTTNIGALYLAMEFVEGLPLDEYIKESPASRDTIINLFLQICSAVEYLHSTGFALNDFQAENIVVRRGPQPVVTEFSGTAALPDSPQDRRFARSLDVHSLGVLLRDTVVCSAWPELRQVMLKATQPAPADRFPTIADFAQRLQRLL